MRDPKGTRVYAEYAASEEKQDSLIPPVRVEFVDKMGRRASPAYGVRAELQGALER